MHQIDIKDNMLLICPRDIKEKILNDNKSLVDISFMTLEEYKKRYYFDYDYHTVKYLMDTYGYTLNNAKEIIESLYFVEDKDYPNNKLNDLVKIKKELLEKNLLIPNPGARIFGARILYGYGDIRLNDIKILKDTIVDKHYNIYEFDTIESELEYVYESIFELIENNVDINNIYIIASNEYENYFKRYNSYYDFKVNYPSDNSLYGTEAAKKFLEDIKIKDRETIYNELNNKDLVNILNKYLDLNEACDFIVEDLKHIKLNKKYKDVVQVVSNNYLFDDADYVCEDYGFAENEPVDIVIRPEDIDIVPRNRGLLNGEVKSVLFKGVHYEIIAETSSGTSKTVMMHVTGEHDVVNAEAHERMSATSFSMDVEDVKDITDAEIIARANAQAWNDDEEDVSIPNVNYDLKEDEGVYDCTFETAAGTKITIKINVVKPVSVENAGNEESIQAFNFTKSVDEIKESVALDTDLIRWADAYAWSTEDNSQVEIWDVKYDFDDENITEGDYPITFSTQGRELKLETTDHHEVGERVGLEWNPEDIHVMRKMN